MKKKGLFILASLVLVSSVFAHGKGDIEEREVASMDSWQEQFDIDKKKEGKYNVLATVEDKGGNKTVGGPYNIYIDPDSDYTISGITNPIKNMRVPGNLNIVGTCIDDDGVDEVWLVLDGAEPVKTSGKEFWSYYLDTTELTEGPHTIEVYGIDINGLSSQNKPNKKAYVTWNLDRRLPVTEVTNHALGELVSGKITLKGTVSDGNGIKTLQYSLDGRKEFLDVKLKTDKKTGICTFELPLNTSKSPDGAAVCWFKATDKMGSVGYNSYLYFIDNTKPDVKIVYPPEGEAQNGHFGVAGFAKDVIGVQKLTWTCGTQSGEFELTPGNPYWYKEIDSTGLSKNVEFTVTATDTVGNVVTVKRVIPLNQEADKPVVTIEYPAQGGLVDGDAGTVFLRGIVKDDDAVASIEYKLDNGETKTLESQGVFYALLSEEADLAAGNHTVTVTGIDKYGVKGNPVTASFKSKGKVPVFAEAKIAGEAAFTGIKVHPEANPKYETSVSSDAGIASVDWQLNWGENGSKTGSVTLKGGEKTVPVSIPLSGDDIAWGALSLTVTASDIYNRTSQQKTVINVQDITDISAEAPKVVFDDSRVSENGDIINDPEHPVTGYFTGGVIKSASLSPSTPFATIEYNEHTVTLRATESIGASSPVKVRIISQDNLAYESQPLIFHSDSPAPSVTVDQTEENVEIVYDEEGGIVPFNKIKVTGSVTSGTALTSLGYRIISVPAAYDPKVKDLVSGAGSVKFGDFESLPAKTGNFSFELDPANLENGLHVIEVVANNGKEAAGSVKIRKLPPLPAKGADGKKAPVPAKPAYTWIDAVDVYYVITSQVKTSDFGGTYYRADLPAGSPTVSVKDGAGKVISSYQTKKPGSAKVFITRTGDKDYASGMHVALPRGNSNVKALVSVVSDFPVTALNWTISGDKIPGGDEKQSGKIDAKGLKQVDSTHYEAEIPLNNLPVRLNTINVTADTAQGSASYKGTIAVVRERDSSLIDNSRKVYWAPSADTPYDQENARYVLKTGVNFGAFANVMAPVTAAFASAQPGLSVHCDGNFVYVIAEKEGLYKNVAVKVTDSQGISFTSAQVTLLADDAAPAVQIVDPAPHKWVKKNTTLNVTASDTNGIVSVEYSLDNGESWNLAKAGGSGYTAALSLDTYDDGLIPVNVRAKDAAGKYTYTQTVIQKDNVEPDVMVIEPVAEDVVNGENLIAFLVSDKDGHLSRAEYVAPKTGKTAPEPVDVPLGPLVVTHVGTKDKPINDLMVFNFYDEIGNTATVRKWDFIIDQKSDLPVAEVHLPEEDAVITTDFVISGVVIDDDGPSKVYYKIDNGEYRLSSEEFGTSFSIDVPLSSMKDNEHSVTVYAEDLNGVKGPEFVRNFKISLEEPKGAVETPPIDETVRGWVKLTGNATDKNGISKVYISVDNGNTYNEATGNFAHENERSNWAYEFDSRVVQDGTHVVFLKVVDWFGIEGLYSSLINIDNTAPQIDLELPLDDSKTTKMLFFSGQTTDNIGLEKLYITIRSLEGKTVNPKLARIDLTPGEIITESIDLSSLDNGFYNVELTGHDAADNITRVSRNVQLNKKAAMAKVDLLYPLNGEFVQGVFNIYGTAVSEINIENLELLLDGKNISLDEENILTATMSPSGYFKFQLNPQLITEGQHKIQVKANLANVTTIMSNEQYINYSSIGPWVTIDNFTYGDFAIERPYIQGNAGYAIAEEELLAAKAKGAPKERRAAVDAKSVEKVEISFNNGKSFTEVSTAGKWRYRVENEDIAEGYHFLLVRATMKNGEKAVTRTIVQVDKTKPTIRLISPGEGGHFNQSLDFSGLAHDNVALKNVTLALRKGDKASYEVPAFIQGLYLDWHFWGATLFDIGVGLSFFDDNVRLQMQWGQFTEAQWNMFQTSERRYGGDNVIGMKILANVAYIPFMYFLGRDYEWLSANVTIGANFSRFDYSGSGKPQILSALLAQLEFPRVTFAKQKMFRTIALYTEGQLWFIPSDIGGDDVENLIPQISLGLRVNVF
jgi:hypothetical protein